MKEIYLDYNATTPVDHRVLEAMLPFFTDDFANASSQFSHMSLKVQSAVKKSQNQCLQALGASEASLYFTSGATESVNWCLHQFIDQSQPIYASKIDHDASFSLLSNHSGCVFFATDKKGNLDKKDVLDLAHKAPKGSLFTFLFAHNELGTVLDLSDIAPKLKELGHYIHLDATQAIGKIPVNFDDLFADFMSFSGHKVYGPKGVGGLVVNKKTVTNLSPLFYGGGQQEGLRSGTLNTPSIVGLGRALELAQERQSQDFTHYLELKKLFLKEISDLNFTINGGHLDSDLSEEGCLPNTLNITFHSWSSFSPLASKLSPYIVSQASACTSGKAGAPRVLGELNIPPEKTLRVSFGRNTSEDDVLGLTEKLVHSLK